MAEGNLSGVARPPQKTVEYSPENIATATFHEQGTVLRVNTTGGVASFKLTSNGWTLISDEHSSN